MADLSVNDLARQSIFSLMGLESLPQDQKERLVEMAQETIINRTLIRLADLLEEKDLDKFKELIEQGKNQEAFQFLTNNGIDLEQILAHETLAYKNEMATMSEVVRQGEI